MTIVESESEHTKLLQFLYACPVGLIEIDAAGVISIMNPLAVQLLLPIAPTPYMTNLFAVMEPFAPELRNMTDDYAFAQGTICEGHRVFVRPGVEKDEFEAKVLACTLVKLSAERYICTLSDVSKQVAQERRLRQAETWFASLVDSVNDFSVIGLDANGCIEEMNSSLSRQTGFEAHEVAGQTLDIFDGPAEISGGLSMPQQIALARRDGWHLKECWQKRRDGGQYWCQRLIAVRSETEESGERKVLGYTVVLRDVTQQNSDMSKLTQLLRRDHLTGVCNRAYFFELAEQECSRSIRYGQTLSLIAIDLDHFKQVNDRHGHGTGDAVLRGFVKACLPLLRSSDTFARLGGEEFVVLLPSTDLNAAALLAERLREAVAATKIITKHGTMTVTASFGCAERRDLATLSELLASADDSLYRAKSDGRDRVVLSHSDPDISTC